jgi:hypothetical protein
MKLSAKISTFLVLILLILSCSRSEEDVSPRIIKIVDAIALENVLAGEAVGIVGIKPKQYKRYEKLANLATDSELLSLAGHQNGVVRSYAFWALVERNSEFMFETLLQNFDDTTTIATNFGCIVSSEKVGDIYYYQVVPPYYEDQECKLSDSQLQFINDSLLFSPNLALRSRINLFQIIDTSIKNYEIIKEIAVREKIPEVIYALSFYRNKSDIPLIVELLENDSTRYWGFRSINNFPDFEFYGYLVEYLKKESQTASNISIPELEAFYTAIINYENPETKQLLYEVLKVVNKDGNKYHKEYLWKAISQSENEYYKDIFPMMTVLNY